MYWKCEERTGRDHEERRESGDRKAEEWRVRLLQFGVDCVFGHVRKRPIRALAEDRASIE